MDGAHSQGQARSLNLGQPCLALACGALPHCTPHPAQLEREEGARGLCRGQCPTKRWRQKALGGVMQRV